MSSLPLTLRFPGMYLRSRYVLIPLLLAGLMAVHSCKDQPSSEELKREQQRADSLMRAAAEAQKRLETEEELAERIRLLKNKGFTGNDSVYYAAQVTARPDSLLTIITLNGKANRAGNISTFNRTAVTLDAQVAKGTMTGTYFRKDLLGDKTYRLYSYDDISGNVFAYMITASGNALKLTPTAPKGNYRFDLLQYSTFEHTINNERRFFKTIRSSEITDDPLLDSLFNNARIFRDSEALLPEGVTTPFERLWLYGEHGSSNVLLTQPTDSTFSTITLSGKYTNPETEIAISSRFTNDSTWLQSTVKESLIYDHPHLVVYQKDSVNRTFSYGADFHFQLVRTDTVSFKQPYPQYYPDLKDSIFEIRTDKFSMNGKEAYWRYRLGYTKGSKDHRVTVRVNTKDLIDAENNKLIFRLPSAGTPRTAQLPELLTPPVLFKGTDLNFDGADDLSFRKGTDVNNNPIYIVYLYDKGSGRFIRTPDLDGRSVFNGIIRDTIQKKLLYTGYIDNGQMSVSVITPDAVEVKTREIYWTTGNKNKPQVHYQKLVNNSITDKRSPMLDSLPLNGSDLKTALTRYILEQN